MKKIIAMLALGLMVTGVSVAQEGPKKDKKHRTEHRGKKEGRQAKMSPEDRASKRTKKMSQQLGLNQLQTTKLQALNLRHAQEMQNMRGNGANPDERGVKNGEAMKASNARWESELKAILTPRQFAQYETERKQSRQKVEQRSASTNKERDEAFMKRKEARAKQRS